MSALRSEQQAGGMANIDASKYLLCNEPNIWVFDDLLSDKFLDHVDYLFDHGETQYIDQHEGGKARRSRCVQVEVDEDTVELVDVLKTLAGVRQVEECCTFMIADVWGQDQDPHIDHISVTDLENRYGELSFLDFCKQSRSQYNSNKIVPTLSIVVYFNDSGGIRFPLSPSMKESIPSKRGRIVMFQNFHDSQRPVSNQLCSHYGLYFEDVPRRLMTMGILANETPSMDNSGSLIDGLIYCAGVRDQGIYHDWTTPHHASEPSDPPPPPPKPKGDKVFTLDARLEDEEWVVAALSMAGTESCTVRAKKQDTVKWLNSEVKKMVDPEDKVTVHLALSEGQMVVNWKGETSLQHLFMEREAMEIGLVLEPDMRTKVWQMFVKTDIDCSGEISTEELLTLFLQLDPSLLPDDIMDVFKGLDVNSDGKLQFSEFLQLIYFYPDAEV